MFLGSQPFDLSVLSESCETGIKTTNMVLTRRMLKIPWTARIINEIVLRTLFAKQGELSRVKKFDTLDIY